MSSTLPRPAPWVAWLLFVGLLLGQLGEGLSTAWAGAEVDDCCAAEQGEAAEGRGDETAEHDLCPPGCDHCVCCASVLAVLTGWPTRFPQPPAADAIDHHPPDDASAGRAPRVYRPPQTSPT